MGNEGKHCKTKMLKAEELALKSMEVITQQYRLIVVVRLVNENLVTN